MKNNLWENILIAISLIYGSILIINIIIIGFWSSIVLFLSLIIGLLAFNLCLKSVNDLPNLWFGKTHKISSNICFDLIQNESQISSVCLICGDICCERHDSRLSVNPQPWKGFKIDKRVDDAIQQILELTLKEFVNSWLEEIATNTNKLDIELRHILRTILSALIRRTKNGVNITDVLLEKLPKVLTHHLEMFVKGKRHSKTAQHLEEAVLKEYGHLLHPAMNSREDEVKYLTSIVESVMPFLLPPKYLNCKVVQCFFRELMACSVLLPAIDICGDPDKVNALLVLLLDETHLSDDYNANLNDDNMVEILERFTSNITSVESNNLGIDLKRILSDQQLLFLFQQFSKEEGFINLVQFILHIKSFTQRILNPDLTQQELKELHIESINIFNSYFKPNSIDHINFSKDIFDGFSQIVNGNFQDVEKFRTTLPLYDAYDYIYNLLETYYCPLFLQSDIYFKLVCGQRWTNSDCSLTKTDNKSINSRSNSSESISMMNRFDETNNESIDCLDDMSYQLSHEYVRLSQNGNSDMLEHSFSCDDRLKDLSAWRVSLPSVDSRIDINGREYDFFLIEVQRLDVHQEETFDFSWTVERRYNEFYVLESKLKEFHGQKLSEICLPPKRSFVKMSKPFLESRRPEFEKFLKQLLGSAQLKGSELVYNFLRSSEGFTTGFLPDIKIGKMIKTVPAKFSKERGQHLEPFLLSFISSTEQMKPKPVKNEISELLEYSPSEFAMANLHRSLYQNMGQWNGNYITDNEISKSETSSERIYAQLDFVYDYILFFLIRFYNLNNWFLKFLFMFRPLFRKTLQSMSEWYLKTKLKKSLLVPQRIVELIHLLRDSLYFEKDIPLRTSQQKNQRSQLALKYAKEFIPNWVVVNILGKEKHEEVMFLLFSIFQYPLLNKQLLYLIFDIIVKELFPEILLSNINISENSNLVKQN